MPVHPVHPPGKCDVLPLAEVDHSGSEVTGPAFSPDGTRLYFNSQRGPSVLGNHGVTFEISGRLRRVEDIFRNGFAAAG